MSILTWLRPPVAAVSTPITRALLYAVAPSADPTTWLHPLNTAAAKCEITTRNRIAAFLAQTAFESGWFACLEEDLDYSADALLRSWPKLFDEANVGAYAHNPAKIANRAYANRMGNGNEASGDG